LKVALVLLSPRFHQWWVVSDVPKGSQPWLGCDGFEPPGWPTTIATLPTDETAVGCV
jgi:hypothetical protein